MATSDAAQRLCDDLADRVAALRTSAEWLEAMTAAARFHDYSFGNWLLLWSQAEQRETTVTRPAGYRTWQQLGRHVRRGESGLQDPGAGHPPRPRRRRSDGGGADPAGGGAGSGWRPSSTTARPRASPCPRWRRERLTGDDGADLFEHAAGMIRAEGYSFELGRLAGPNGLTRPTERTGDRGRSARAGAADQDHGSRAGARAACMPGETGSSVGAGSRWRPSRWRSACAASPGSTPPPTRWPTWPDGPKPPPTPPGRCSHRPNESLRTSRNIIESMQAPDFYQM